MNTDYFLIAQAQLLSTGTHCHRCANLVAAYEGAVELAHQAQQELRAFVRERKSERTGLDQ